MSKEELREFLEWLDKEGIARWFFVEERGIDNIIEKYLGQKKDEERL